MPARRRVPRLLTMTTLSTAAMHPEAGERLLTPAFIRLTLADVAYFTSAGVAIYALPLWVTGPVGSGKSGAGLAFGAFAVSALILRPVAEGGPGSSRLLCVGRSHGRIVCLRLLASRRGRAHAGKHAAVRVRARRCRRQAIARSIS
jgi:hypothetical protein